EIDHRRRHAAGRRIRNRRMGRAAGRLQAGSADAVFPHARGSRPRRDRRLPRGSGVSASAAYDPAAARAQAQRLMDVWRTPTGWRYWSDVNNTTVGRWYTAAAFLFLVFGGVLALIMRAQLAVPNNDLVSADFYNQALTLHGSV